MSNSSKKKFIDNYQFGIPQILNRQFIADTETPVSTMLKISKNEKYSFLVIFQGENNYFYLFFPIFVFCSHFSFLLNSLVISLFFLT